MNRILVLRRDNIGDLVCTTPMIALLRAHFPQAWLGALVTHYNADVLAGNPDLDAVFTYRKAKHLAAGESSLSVYAARIRQIWQLRRLKLDAVILPASGYQASAMRLARWLAPRQILTTQGADRPRHEVERCADTLRPLGITAPPPPMHVFPDPLARHQAEQAWAPFGLPTGTPRIAMHISARKPNQRWPAEHFAQLMHALHAQEGAAFLLLWSPGAQNNPLHPGDDEKAARIVSLTRDLPVLAYATHTVKDLIAALATTDSMICSDGGAMHLAAGLGKPIACFFGSSDVTTWRPWGVPHHVLQADSRVVADVSVEAALAGWAAIAPHRVPVARAG